VTELTPPGSKVAGAGGRMWASLLESILHRNGSLRPVWRITLFLLFFALFSVAGLAMLSLLPPGARAWSSLIVLSGAALLASWVLLARVEHRPLAALGFGLHSATTRETLLGIAVGGALIAATVVLLLATGAARFTADAGTAIDYLRFLAWTLLFFAVAAAFEELIFRGYPFQVLVAWIGPWPAILVGSALFSALHAGNPNITLVAFANIFLAGILLSVAYLRTRSLWFATGVHVGWNWSMASLFDFPVSGLGFETPLYSAAPVGAEWWTGGDFGPEAGLVGTIVLLAGTAWLLRSGSPGVAPGTRAARPLVDDRLGSGGFG